jgi:hypothetical protein
VDDEIRRPPIGQAQHTSGHRPRGDGREAFPVHAPRAFPADHGGEARQFRADRVQIGRAEIDVAEARPLDQRGEARAATHGDIVAASRRCERHRKDRQQVADPGHGRDKKAHSSVGDAPDAVLALPLHPRIVEAAGQVRLGRVSGSVAIGHADRFWVQAALATFLAADRSMTPIAKRAGRGSVGRTPDMDR